jgi:hypothetical protein
MGMASSDVSLRELAQMIKRIDERTAHIDTRTAHIDDLTKVIASGMRLPSGISLSNAIGQILNAVS